LNDGASLCPELTSRHPEIKERPDAIVRCRKASERMTHPQAAEVVGHGLSTLKGRIKLPEAGGSVNLAKRPTRPHNMRPREKRAPELVAQITEMRSERFAWGRDKICSRLRNLGWEISETAIGRIIGELLRKGKIKPIEPAKRQAPSRARREGRQEAGAETAEAEAQACRETEARACRGGR